MVFNCLTEADSCGYKSIAFPALGTGNLNFPAAECAQLFEAEVREFLMTNPETSLRDIRVVVPGSQQDVIEVGIIHTHTHANMHTNIHVCIHMQLDLFLCTCMLKKISEKIVFLHPRLQINYDDCMKSLTP